MLPVAASRANSDQHPLNAENGKLFLLDQADRVALAERHASAKAACQ